MNTAIILAGGIGSRMKAAGRPKQYIEVMGKPVILYCLETFQRNNKIGGILIVADECWRAYLLEWIERQSITKFLGFAGAGRTRQHSIYEGLKACETYTKPEEAVVIHDAARPLVSDAVIDACVEKALEADGAMPVLPLKDTVYQSRDGKSITNLLERNELFAGQAPEGFRFGKYYEIHNSVSDKEIAETKGSSEIAYRHGLCVSLFPGEEQNFKITTMEDLKNFETELKRQSGC